MSGGVTKQCSKCGKIKETSEFYRDHTKSDGFHSSCISCNKELRKNYRAPNHAKNNRKYERGRRAEYYKKNPLNYLYDIAKKRAKKTGIPFCIVPEDIIYTGICPVTGVTLDINTNKINNSISLDRVDNTKGYIPGNVVAISRWANLKKSDLTVSDLERIISYMKNYMNV